jgi:hypothetical protein
MKTPPLPPHRVTHQPLPGSAHSATAIYVGDQLVYSCLGVLSTDDVEQRIRQWMAPPAPARRTPAFSDHGGPVKPRGGRRMKAHRDDEQGEDD